LSRLPPPFFEQVLAVSKTTTGTNRLLRDKLFREKLMQTIEAPCLASSFEHSMLKKCAAAFQTLTNICAQTLGGGEMIGGGLDGKPGVGGGGGKGLPTAEIMRQCFVLADVLFDEGVGRDKMSDLGGKPPAKLTADLVRLLCTLSKRMSVDEGGSMPDDLVKGLSRVACSAISTKIETASQTRLSALEMMSCVAAAAAEAASVGCAWFEVVKRGELPGLIAGCLLDESASQATVNAAVVALADIVHVQAPLPLPFPLSGEGEGSREYMDSVAAAAEGCQAVEAVWAALRCVLARALPRE
jgi:hypothetical protein